MEKTVGNILITSAGRRVSLVKSFQSTVKKFNKDAKVFTADMSPLMSSACQLSDGFFKVPAVKDRDYIDTIEQICLQENISIVVPTIDTELSVLARAKERFRRLDILIAVSSEKICDTFYLKSSTEEFFLLHGFNTPRSIDDIQKSSYPLFAKLNNSSSSFGALRVENYQQAKELLKRDKNYIFQEYIDADEFTVDIFMDSFGNCISIVPRQRLEVRAGEVSKALSFKDSDIIKEVKKLCSVLKGAYGPITVQLFKKKESIIFIEINPRFGGGYPLSYLCGADFVSYLIRDYLSQKLDYDDSWRDKTLMLRYDAEVVKDDFGV